MLTVYVVARMVIVPHVQLMVMPSIVYHRRQRVYFRAHYQRRCNEQSATDSAVADHAAAGYGTARYVQHIRIRSKIHSTGRGGRGIEHLRWPRAGRMFHDR